MQSGQRCFRTSACSDGSLTASGDGGPERTEMLLLEEQFHLPSVAIEVGNGHCWDGER